MKSSPVVSIVRLSGVLGSGGRFSARLNDQSVSKEINHAFSGRRVKAVALEINSPGGSPTQSALIFQRIRRLAKQKKIPVYAFCEDIVASGGYMIACSADCIYADENSIVGSIGVISSSFGFQDIIKKAGIERRVYTSGDSKSFLDPFLPPKQEDIDRLRELQNTIHQQFIDHVKRSRGKRLHDKMDSLFSGKFWAGREAVKLGLADGIGHLEDVMRKKFGEKTVFRREKPRRGFASQIFSQISSNVAGSVLERVEDQVNFSTWSR